MSRLILADLGRLRSRRWFWGLALAAVLLLGAFQIVVNGQVSPPSAAELAQDQATYQSALQDHQINSGQAHADCMDNGGTRDECSRDEPKLSEYVRTVAPYAEAAQTSLTIAVVLGWLVAFVVGGAAIGAEHATGSLGNGLTSVPRRGRVFASTLVAVVLSCAALTAVLAVLGLLVPAVLVEVHGGSIHGVGTLAATAGRGVLTAAVLAMIGCCLTTLFRHTMATLGVALGYLLSVFVRGALLVGIRWAQQITPWLPEANLLAVYLGRYPYDVPPPGSTAFSETMPTTLTVSLTHGLLYLAGLLIVLVSVTVVTFRRREVA